MKLTVGPLPSAVYWRRRAVLLGVLLVAVSVLWVSIANASRSESSGKSRVPSAAPSPSVLLTPSLEGLDSADPAAGTQAGGKAPALPPPTEPVVTPCADTEIALTPTAEPDPAERGATVRLWLKVRNISTRTCSRDLGADAQELYIQSGDEKVWSSDACNPVHGVSVQNLTAGATQSFHVDWGGKASSAGCDDAKRVVPPAGKYELFGRLATKVSDPFAMTLS